MRTTYISPVERYTYLHPRDPRIL